MPSRGEVAYCLEATDNWKAFCDMQIKSSLIGLHNLYNILAAVAVGVATGVNLKVLTLPSDSRQSAQMRQARTAHCYK